MLSRAPFLSLLLLTAIPLRAAEPASAPSPAQSSPAAEPESVDKQLESARAYLAKGNLDEARAGFQKALSQTRDPNAIRAELAQLELRAKNYRAAQTLMDEVFRSEASLDERLRHFPLLLRAYEKDGKTRELFERFPYDPTEPGRNWENALYAAIAYRSQADRTSAFSVLSRALDARPDEPSLLRALIFALFAEHNAADALPYAQRLAALAPTPGHQFLLAETTLAAGGYDEFFRFLSEFPESIKAHPISWAQLYPSLRGHPRQDEAAALLEKAVKTAPPGPEQRMALIELYLASGQRERLEGPLWELYREYAALLRKNPERKPTSACSGHTISVINHWSRYHSLRSTAALPVQLSHRKWDPITAEPQSPPLAPAAVHDQALLFLAALAVDQRQEERFLAQLEESLEGTDLREQLIAYMITGSIPQMEEKLTRLLDSGSASFDDLRMAVEIFNSRGTIPISPAPKERLITAIRDAAAQGAAPDLDSLRWTRRVLNLLDAPHAADEATRRWLKTAEAEKKTKEANALREGLDRAPAPGKAPGQPAPISAEQLGEEIVTAYRLQIIDRPAPDTRLPFAIPYGIHVYIVFPRQSPLFSPESTAFVATQSARLFAHPAAIDPVLKAIAALPAGERQPQHEFAQAILLWNLQRPDRALSHLRKVAATSSDPAVLLDIAMAEAEAGNTQEALALLKELPPEAESGKRSVLQRLFRSTRDTQDRDLQKELLALLTSYDLNTNETSEVLFALYHLGMKEQIAKLESPHPVTRLSGPFQSSSAGQHFQQLRQSQDKEQGVALAIGYLERSPSIYAEWPGEEYNRREALELLKHFEQITAYQETLESRAREEEEVSLTTRLRLLELYAFLKDPRLSEQARALAGKLPEDARLQAHLGQMLIRAGFETPGLDYLTEAFRRQPALFPAYGLNAISSYKQAKRLQTLIDIALAADSKHDFFPPTGQPIWFYQRLGDAVVEDSPKTAIRLWEKGLAVEKERPPDAGRLHEWLIESSAKEGNREQLANQLISYFFSAPKQSPLAPWIAFHRQPGAQWLDDLYEAPDGRRHLRALKLLRIGLEAGLKNKLVDARQRSGGKSLFFDQLLRVAERDPAVLEELLVMTPPPEDRHRFPRYLQAIARDAASWPDAGELPLRLLQRVAADPSFNARSTDIHDEIVELAGKSGDPEIHRQACREWFKAFQITPRGSFYDSRRMGRMALVFVEADMMKEAREIYARASSPEYAHHQDPQTLATLKAIFDAQDGHYHSPLATVGLLAPSSEEKKAVTLFWSIAPEGSPDKLPFIASKVFPIYDGLFELELLHRTPPNKVRRIATLPAVKTAGEWRGTLPSDRGELSARLIDKEGVAYEGIWLNYSISANVLPPLSGEQWSLPASVTLAPLENAPHQGLEGVELVMESSKEQTVLSPAVPLQSDTIYLLSGWLYQKQAHSGWLMLEGKNSQGESVFSAHIASGNSSIPGWSYFSQKVAFNSSSRRRASDVREINNRATELSVKIMLRRNASIADLRLTMIPPEE